MEPYLWPAVIGTAAGAGALVFWKLSSDRTRILARMALGFGPVTLAAGLAFGLLAVLTPARPPAETGTPAQASAPPKLPPGDYRAAPLGPGEKAPPFDVEGWLNEPPPPAWGAEGSRITVVDFWALWCPGCRATAPGLVHVYHKYKNRGVAFVSLTNHPRPSAEQFVHDFMVPWPCAYGTTDQTIARFGAFNHGNRLRGYELKLALYLVGPDGRVLWNDGHARMKHQDPGLGVQRLDEEIEKVLPASAPQNPR